MTWRILTTGRRWLGCILLALAGAAHAQVASVAEEVAFADDITLKDDAVVAKELPPVPDTDPTAPDQQTVPAHDTPPTIPWLDRAHLWLFNTVWRSARSIDSWFGPKQPVNAYQGAQGSIAPALLWDEFDGFQPKLRFNVDLPLPRLNEQFRAFIGRVNRDEYVTERDISSGAFPSQIGRVEEDQTILGLRYRSPKQGAHFESDVGVRLRFPVDPFVKGSYVFQRGDSGSALFQLRETAFWQNSEGLGFTSRFDVERLIDMQWLVSGTISGTISQESKGPKGYTAITVLRGFPNRRAFAAQVFSRGEMKAEVPLQDYGIKLAYRKSVMRDWLILEVRTSLTWPKDKPTQDRVSNIGVGIGFEAFFGTEEFLARPVTF